MCNYKYTQVLKLHASINQSQNRTMEKIEHTTVAANGLNIHVASAGTGTRTILFLHGFPQLWYTWRHQLISLSSLGYRCIAPDLRGYGDTTDVVHSPPSSSPAAAYTSFLIVGDLVALLDALEIEQVFLVGHDWGAIIAWHFCLFRPDRVKALVNTSVPFRPRYSSPAVTPMQGARAVLGDNFYMWRFQKPGEAEAEFAEVDTKKLIVKFLGYRSPDPPCVPKEIGFGGWPDPPCLPTWLTQEDVDYYADKFDKTGFTGGLNYYRAIDLTWEMMAAWTGAKVTVPTKFIVGEVDLTLKFPGTEEYIGSGGFKEYVPLLEEIVVLKDVGHFLVEEKPEEITKHIYDFFNKF
ncbi:Epoxide hydrolase A [Linum grandiflorum]